MDDDYDDFFRQDISEGKDDDEDKDIPSVSPFSYKYRYYGHIFNLGCVCMMKTKTLMYAALGVECV